MFEKLIKMEFFQNAALFSGVAVGIAMGMFWIGTTLSGTPPYAPFEFAPSIFFLTTALLVWTKILYDVMSRSFQAPTSTLMMTLPISEEIIVQSKLFVSTLAGSVLAFIAGLIILYWGVLGDGLDVLLTGLASMFVDLHYSAWVAAFSIGMIPILVVIEQCCFHSMLLMITLRLRNSTVLQKCSGLVYVLLMILQIRFVLWMIMNYPAFICRVHPLAITGVLTVVFGIGVLFLYKGCVKYLKYQYQD